MVPLYFFLLFEHLFCVFCLLTILYFYATIVIESRGVKGIRVRAHKSKETKEKKVYILIPFSYCSCYNILVPREQKEGMNHE